ncbi:MAG: SPFH domain-containing protein [Oscillospiraceae bacterium]|nr:SPFH domain-containing protein [Oscillospiraceae bacterium]
MGIIKAALSAVGGGLADQWLEVIEAGDMDDTTVMAPGVTVRRDDSRNQNRKGTTGVVSNGSMIQVGQNQFMLLVDGGKVVDYTAEPGYYKVDNSASPSLFNGQFKDTLLEAFNRIKFGGVTPYSQKVYFINLQEIKNIPFGTVNPINYFDNFYNSELFLRANGYFSIKITNPLQFYAEAIPRNAEHVKITDIHQLYLSEFLNALQSVMNQMSVDGIRISHVTSKGTELAKYMAGVLDEDWNANRGMQVQSVGINSISYDEESKKLINMRNQGAMLSDPGVREGYVQGSVARGMEAAGSNQQGAAAAFMGMGVGMQAGGGFMGAASASNQQQMAAQQQAAAQQRPAAPAPGADSWTCACGSVAEGKFCAQCGAPRPAAPAAEGEWLCSCGNRSSGKFCSHCGKKRPEEGLCPKCGAKNIPGAKFCSECGQKL